MKRIPETILGLFLLCSCGSHGTPVAEAVSFPLPVIPSVCTTVEERQDYMLMHYWDAFFKLEGRTDSAKVFGVAKAEVEQAFANYAGILGTVSVEAAGKGMAKMFSLTDGRQSKDTSSLQYYHMTDIVSRYLYDPNSPLRNEDWYLPFVKGMAASPNTDPSMKAAYEYEAQSCSICRHGTTAPDFSVRTITGRTFSLHSVKADWTMLFFSNPGCNACKTIVEQVQADPTAASMIISGELAVVNVYIDEDLKAWREYEHNYPSSWHTGYDLRHVIRGERLYDVRAIPSLYLLDSGKRVMMKDAPTEAVLTRLHTIKQQ